MFPAKQPSKVVIKTKDGNEYSEYMEYPKGDPREPMTIEDIDNKFAGLAEGTLSTDRQNEIKDLILNCEAITINDFMKKLVI
jgi:2-methylcitrate dehydratase